MELKAKVVDILAEQTGEGKNGKWRKQEYIIETEAQYPKKVCVEVWGEKIDQFGLKKGDVATFGLDVESREYNGRWYTNVKIWKANKERASSGSTPSQAGVDPEPNYEQFVPNTKEEDDLPF
jgi:hypothetical protein